MKKQNGNNKISNFKPLKIMFNWIIYPPNYLKPLFETVFVILFFILFYQFF